MASDSGRPNEFSEEAHFWPEDPSAEDMKLWLSPPATSERVVSPAETAHELLVGIQFENKNFQIPVRIRKEEND